MHFIHIQDLFSFGIIHHCPLKKNQLSRWCRNPFRTNQIYISRFSNARNSVLDSKFPKTTAIYCPIVLDSKFPKTIAIYCPTPIYKIHKTYFLISKSCRNLFYANFISNLMFSNIPWSKSTQTRPIGVVCVK